MNLEVVSAKLGTRHYERQYNYFAPRRTTKKEIPATSDKRIPYNETVHFKNFLVPPGGEENTFVCITLFAHGKRLGEAYAGLAVRDWNIGQHEISCEITLVFGP